MRNLKIPKSALLATATIATVIAVSQGFADRSEEPITDDKPDAVSVAKQNKTIATKKEDRVVAKSDYLPDVLGRVGYAAIVADQKQPESIANFRKPEPVLIYDDGTTSLTTPIDRVEEVKSLIQPFVESETKPIVPEHVKEMITPTIVASVLANKSEEPKMKLEVETPDIKPEVVPEVPEMAPEVVIPETPEVITPELPEVTTEVVVPETPEVTPEVVVPEVTPEVITPEVVIPEVPETTPEVITPELPEVTPEIVVPEVTPEVVPP